MYKMRYIYMYIIYIYTYTYTYISIIYIYIYINMCEENTGLATGHNRIGFPRARVKGDLA